MEKWELKKHGDDLEKAYAEEIIIKAYAYELIWSSFIGNNGFNQLVPLENLQVEKNDFRKRFSEHHYTIIQSILCLGIIKNDIIAFDNYQRDFTLRLQNNLVGFYAHMGRIFDNLLQLVYYYGKITDKIMNDLDLDEISHDTKFIRPFIKELEEFYYQRHIVLHGKQVPLDFDKIGNIIFPKLKTEKNSPVGYDKTMMWSERFEMVPLVDSITEIELNLPSCVNNILHSIFKGLKEYLIKKRIVITPPSNIANEKVNPSVGVDVYNLQGKQLRGYSGYSGYSASLASSKD